MLCRCMEIQWCWKERILLDIEMPPCERAATMDMGLRGDKSERLVASLLFWYVAQLHASPERKMSALKRSCGWRGEKKRTLLNEFLALLQEMACYRLQSLLQLMNLNGSGLCPNKIQKRKQNIFMNNFRSQSKPLLFQGRFWWFAITSLLKRETQENQQKKPSKKGRVNRWRWTCFEHHWAKRSHQKYLPHSDEEHQSAGAQLISV